MYNEIYSNNRLFIVLKTFPSMKVKMRRSDWGGNGSSRRQGSAKMKILLLQTLPPVFIGCL